MLHSSVREGTGGTCKSLRSVGLVPRKTSLRSFSHGVNGAGQLQSFPLKWSVTCEVRMSVTFGSYLLINRVIVLSYSENL